MSPAPRLQRLVLLTILLLFNSYFVAAQNSQPTQISNLPEYLESLLPTGVEGRVINDGGNIEARFIVDQPNPEESARKIARDYIIAAYNSGLSIRSARIDIVQPTGEIGLSITLGANIASGYNWIEPTADPSTFIEWIKNIVAQQPKGLGVARASLKNVVSIKGPWSELTSQAETVEPARRSRTQTQATVYELEKIAPTPSLNNEYADEIALGLSQRSALLSYRREIKNSKEDALAQSVFSRLRGTQTFQYGPALPYRVTIIEDDSPNAFAKAGGDIYVTSGLAEILGNDEGLWAAAMGHEFGHSIKQHVYKSYFREVQLRQQIETLRIRAAAGDKSASWSLIAVAVAGRLLNNKMERNDENEADKLGLEMMIEAGYHPDFAITLYRKLKALFGERSKFGALFSDHPRWTTREERVMKLFDESLGRFESLWPDVAQSPGGRPPIMATLGKISSKENKPQKTVLMQIPYNVRNARNLKIDAVVYFTFKGASVASPLSEFRAKDGSLMPVKSFIPVSGNESGVVEVTVPSAAIGIRERKLKARLCLHNQSALLECSKEKDIPFPKN